MQQPWLGLESGAWFTACGERGLWKARGPLGPCGPIGGGCGWVRPRLGRGRRAALSAIWCRQGLSWRAIWSRPVAVGFLQEWTPLGRCRIASESAIDCPSWNTFSCSVGRRSPFDGGSKPTGSVTTCCRTYFLISGRELSVATISPPAGLWPPGPSRVGRGEERFGAAGLGSRLRGVGDSLEAIVYGVSRRRRHAPLRPRAASCREQSAQTHANLFQQTAALGENKNGRKRRAGSAGLELGENKTGRKYQPVNFKLCLV